MIEFFIYFIVYYIVICLLHPIIILVHELGHAFFALLFTKGQVNIIIGSKKSKKYTLKIKRLRICFSKFTFFYSGFVKCSEIPVEKYKRILIFIGGPISSLLLILSCSYILMLIDSLVIKIVLRALVYGSILTFVITVIPITYKSKNYKGMKSDILNVIHILRE